jgi:crossover junction endodeoxyribonuclease RusA
MRGHQASEVRKRVTSEHRHMVSTITLPWPPSVNHYYRHVGHRTLISREGRQYRTKVCSELSGGGPRKPPAGGRIALCMDAFPPDRRRRDLDNLTKSVQDSLQHAGVYEDDSQIDMLAVRRMTPTPGGRLVVRITDLPMTECPICGHRKEN